MQLERAAGILLHPSSLPSAFGIGDLGEGAYRFIDFLMRSGQRIWQMLPLNPVGYGESPYQAYSAFAGNFYLIDPLDLVKRGLLLEEELTKPPYLNQHRVNYSLVKPYKMKLLKLAYERFRLEALSAEYLQFLQDNKYWLPDYALFMSVKKHLGGLPWSEWPEDIATRRQEALISYGQKLQTEIEFHYFLQYSFFYQWQSLLHYARRQGIKIMGDIPLFVAADSCDTWVDPQWYYLNPTGSPTKVAGVPPDYFSKTGQRWGNPIYRWEEMKKDGYSWWVQRVKQMLDNFDYVRLDHFRGLAACWEMPAEEETAVNGCWMQGPGEHFFALLSDKLGNLPLVVEDLGYITPDVKMLKKFCGFPGMKVLQFLSSEKWPAGTENNNVVYYTGTHDNDTLFGWYCKEILADLSRPQENPAICREFIEALYKSKAAWVIVPMQDWLCLGSEARMNTPGTVGNNWSWRLEPDALTASLAEEIASFSRKYLR